ncbi:MAG: glycosyltransferase [Desulfatitalea sp.]
MSIKISVGMIVLNGEPFLRYNLRALYPFVHQIIVVEGACQSAAAIATCDGHSTDGTLETLRDFKAHEDPENKVRIVTAADEGYVDGFWPEKDEMSWAYAKRATGEYLWQVDSDEFYHEEHIPRLLRFIERTRPDAVSFPMVPFWGDLAYNVNSFRLIRDNSREYHRLFAWGPGYSYKTHRPPTVIDDKGVETRKKHWVRARDLEKEGIYLFHYSLLFPHQVFNKVSYYKERLQSDIDAWEETVYRRLEKPFRAHNAYQYIGWLERFKGEHPLSSRTMMVDIESKKLNVPLRDCADVERLLGNRFYVAATKVLRFCATAMAIPPLYVMYRAYRRTRHLLFAR